MDVEVGEKLCLWCVLNFFLHNKFIKQGFLKVTLGQSIK